MNVALLLIVGVILLVANLWTPATNQLNANASEPNHVQKQYFPSLHGLQSLLVSWVIIYHFSKDWNMAIKMNAHEIEIQLFFLLAGFNFACSCRHVEWNSTTALTYYWKRLQKLYPPHVFSVLLIWLLCLQYNITS